jgi:parallel beta-helix repeat protein
MSREPADARRIIALAIPLFVFVAIVLAQAVTADTTVSGSGLNTSGYVNSSGFYQNGNVLPTNTYNSTYDTYAYNQTAAAINYILTNPNNWLNSSYNSTYNSWAYNQSLAAVNYILSNPYGWLNNSYNSTYDLFYRTNTSATANNSFYLNGQLSSYYLNSTTSINGEPLFNGNWTYLSGKPNNTYNSTYNAFIGNCSIGQVIQNITSSAMQCAPISNGFISNNAVNGSQIQSGSIGTPNLASGFSILWGNVTGYNLNSAWTGLLGFGNLTSFNLNQAWSGLLGWGNITGYNLNSAWTGTLGGQNITAGTINNTQLATGNYAAITGLGNQAQNLNMGNNNIVNASWINGTNFNSSQVCIGGNCQTTWPSSSSVSINSTAEYIISTDGTNVYAQNGTTGTVVFSGTNAATVIDSAISTLTNGGKVFIKAGTYTLTNYGSGQIGSNGFGYYAVSNMGNNNIELYGEGPATILQISASAPQNMTAIYFNGTGLSNFIIHDLKIDGNRANRAGYSTSGNENGVFIAGGSYTTSSNWCGNCINNVLIYNTQVVNFWTYGIVGLWLNHFKVSNSIFNNNAADALAGWGDVDVNFLDNSVSNSSDCGITVSNSTSVIFDGNYINNITLGVSPFGLNSGNGFSIQSSPSSNIIISHNIVSNAGEAVTSNPSSGSVTNLQILSNNFKNIGGITYSYATYVKNTNKILYQGNTLDTTFGPASVGFFYDTGCSQIQISNNQFLDISDSTYTQPTITGNGNQVGLMIENNYFYNSQGIPINLFGIVYSTIEGNTIDTGSAGKSAISISDQGSMASADNLIEGNNIYNVSWASSSSGGIYLGGSTGARNNTISGNQVSMSNGVGIYLDTKSSYNYVIGNDLRGSTTPLTDVGVSDVIRNNLGYITENKGNITVANNGWFAHGLSKTPTSIVITTINATYGTPAVPVVMGIIAANSTQVQVSVYWTNGTAITTALQAYWSAQV